MFVVYRPRGSAAPLTYTDLGPKSWPLNAGVLAAAVHVVRWADAKMSQDPIRVLDEMNRIRADLKDQENRHFVNERFPDFMKDYKRAVEILTDGRRREKMVDLGALAPRFN